MAAFTKSSTPLGWSITDENSDGRWIDMQDYTEEQTDYAVMLLEAGVDEADLPEMILYTNCVSCEATFMQAQLDGSKRCMDCQS